MVRAMWNARLHEHRKVLDATKAFKSRVSYDNGQAHRAR